MKDKLMILALAVALLVGLVPPSSAMANTTETKGESLNRTIAQLGLNLPEFEVDDSKEYLFFKTTRLYYKYGTEGAYAYVVLEIDSDNRMMMCHNGSSLDFRKYETSSTSTENFNVSVKAYVIENNKVDYTGDEWALTYDMVVNGIVSRKSGGSSEYLWSSKDIYTNIYGDGILRRSDLKYTMPDIPNIIKEQAETYVVGYNSPMRVEDARKPFMLVGGGVPFLRESDRAICFLESDNVYSTDVELWLVDENDEWYLAQSGLNGYGSTSKTGYSVEYAPEIVYTNKTIYMQDTTSENVTIGTEVYSEIKLPTINEVIIVTSGFPRMYEVSDSFGYIRESADMTSNVVVMQACGKGGIVNGYTVDDSGTAWYSVSFVSSGNEYQGYVLAKSIEVGASIHSTGDESGGSGASSGFNIITYTNKIKAEVKENSVNMRDYPSMDGNLVASFVKTWNVDVLGYVYDSEGSVWYYCKTLRDDMEYIGFMKAEYLTVLSVENNDVGFDEIELDDLPGMIETARNSFIKMLGLVGVVPMMISVVFGFLPTWCTGLMCVTIVVLCLEAITKRG